MIWMAPGFSALLGEITLRTCAKTDLGWLHGSEIMFTTGGKPDLAAGARFVSLSQGNNLGLLLAARCVSRWAGNHPLRPGLRVAERRHQSIMMRIADKYSEACQLLLTPQKFNLG